MSDKAKITWLGIVIGFALGGLIGSAALGLWGGLAGSGVGAVFGGTTIGWFGRAALNALPPTPEEEPDEQHRPVS
jgi:hypothetical protein